MPRRAVAMALPRHEFDAVRTVLSGAGYEALPVGSVSDLERILRSRSDVALAVIDVEAGPDAHAMHELLHEDGRDIAALLLLPEKSPEVAAPEVAVPNLSVVEPNLAGDEYVRRPCSAESLRWRIEAMVIRSDASAEPGVGGLLSATGTAAWPSWEPAEPLAGEALAEASSGRVVIVFNPKGGVGKTTIAINLGAILQLDRAQRVLLVDCDTITGHIASSLGMEGLRTVAQVWNEQLATGETPASLEQIATVHSSGLSILVLSSSPLRTEALAPDRVASAIAEAREKYDWIILDLHPDYGPLNQNLFALADRILVPVTPELPTIRAAVQFRGVAEELGIRDRVSIVLNRSRSGVSSADVERVVAIPILAQVRSAGTLFVKAADQGRAAVEVSPNAEVVGDLARLGEQLMRLAHKAGASPARPRPRGVRELIGRFGSQG